MMKPQEAVDLLRSHDLTGIGMAADALRRKLHPEGVVSYIIDRNINYTNFCTEYCSSAPSTGPWAIRKATSTATT
jgi:cyclic dehypoxanthinyl futalosine synthase